MRGNHSSVMKIDAVGVLAVAAVLAAIGFLVVAPALAERGESSGRRAALDSIEAETDAVLTTLRATNTRLRQSKREAEELPDHLRTRRDLNSKIAEIVASTEANGLAVQAIEPGQAEEGAVYTRTPIELSTAGSIDAVARYLHRIHADSPDLEITNLDIRDPDGSGALSATIRAEWITLTP